MKKIVILGMALLIITAGCLGESDMMDDDMNDDMMEEDMSDSSMGVSMIEAGKTVFSQNCRVCHGADGKGNPEIGAADLTSQSVKSLPRERKIDQVTNGGVQMPSFKQALSSEEIEAVVSYIDTL